MKTSDYVYAQEIFRTICFLAKIGMANKAKFLTVVYVGLCEKLGV